MAQTKAKTKWERKNTTVVTMKLNKNTDAEIIEKLESVGSKQGYIKELIRADIARDDFIKPDYKGLLRATKAIRAFLDGWCWASSSIYTDNDSRSVMHTDTGYFDEGLDDLKEYLEQKIYEGGDSK